MDKGANKMRLLGSADDVKQSMYDHINNCIEEFEAYYDGYLKRKIKINSDNAEQGFCLNVYNLR